MENLRWIAAAALSAYASYLAVHHTTPIDRALPFLAVAVTVLAWLSYREVMIGVPLLIVAEIALPDETLRLLAFGAILAVAFGWGLTPTKARVVVALLAILLLRWIPITDVIFGRELVLLALAVAIVFVLGRTPFAVAVAVITALVTVATPMRTLAIPLAVLLVASVARFFGMPAFRLAWPSTLVLGFVMLFFAWSGIVARAFPYFLRAAVAEKPRHDVKQALAPNRSETYDVPEGKTHLIVSGANVAHLRRGTILGRIEPGHIDVRIGDGVDWGYMRRDAWHKAHNPLPRDSAGKVRDYGYAAWVDGAGRVALPRGTRRIRVTADGALPAHASLQVEGFE